MHIRVGDDIGADRVTPMFNRLSPSEQTGTTQHRFYFG